jgi:ABC-type methionine transport system permease subunit
MRRRSGAGVRSAVVRDLATMFGAFVLASALAGALGAPNLGTAMSYGQMAFAAATVFVLLKR